MSDPHIDPPIKHIPIKHCSACGDYALGGSDYCLRHTAVYDSLIGESTDWASGLVPVDKVKACASHD